MGIKHGNISVSTFHRLALDVSGLSIPRNAPSSFWSEELPEAACERATETFDAVLIDEYQDFQDSWLRLCLKMCKKNKGTENLFLAGDRLQSIYNPKEHTWKSLGINIANGQRSKLLKSCYRAAKSHIKLSLDILTSDPSLEKDVEKFYEGRDGIKHILNSEDQIGLISGDYSQVFSILHDLLFKVGIEHHQILILANNWNDANKFHNNLSPEIKRVSKVCKDVVDGKMIITTYHSSKGLENKICILLNTEKISSKKLLYVGMTRASERLYIHATSFLKGEIPMLIKEYSDGKI